MVIETVVQDDPPHDHLLISSYAGDRNAHVVDASVGALLRPPSQFAQTGRDVFRRDGDHLQFAQQAVGIEPHRQSGVMAVAGHVVELVSIYRAAYDTRKIASSQMAAGAYDPRDQSHRQISLAGREAKTIMIQHS